MPCRIRLWPLVAVLLLAFALPLPSADGGSMSGAALAQAAADHDASAHPACCPVVCQGLPGVPALFAEVAAPRLATAFAWRPEGAPPGAVSSGPEPPPPRAAVVT